MSIPKFIKAYLISAKKVNDDGQVGNDDEPVRVEESESSQQVAGYILISKPAEGTPPSQACDGKLASTLVSQGLLQEECFSLSLWTEST